jgi:hypothetical protein
MPTDIPPVKLPQISVPDLRNMFTFLGGVVSAVQAEAELERETGTRFLYLLDFDTIFDYIAPYLRGGASSRSTLANFLSTADYFEELEEDFSIPLGTFLEISQFLSGRMATFKRLHAVTLSTSSDAALAGLTEYFREERFASVRSLNVEGLPELTEEERLATTQTEAVRLLAESEQGLRRLFSILTHPKLFNVFALIARHPFRFPWESYHDVRAALDAKRSGEGKKNANKADAYNITFANELNLHLKIRAKEGKLKTPYFFRLLTNTLTIHRLSGDSPELSIQFHVSTETGHTIDLLDGTEEATAKRILRKLRTGERLKEVLGFGERRDRAAAALSYLVDAAFDRKQSVEALVQRLQDPQNNRDREIGLDLHGYIKDLDAFFRPDSIFVRKLIETRIRKGLLPEPEGSDRRKEFLPPAVADLARLEGLVTSAQRVLTEIDTLGFELSAIQSGDESKQWVNPIMSLEKLNYQIEASGSGASATWRVTHGRQARVTFCADCLEEGWAMYWPSQMPGAAALKLLHAALGESVAPLDMVTLRLIDFRGNERQSVVAFNALPMSEDEFADVAFVRLEMGHLVFVSELFSPALDYTLMTGIIVLDRIPNLEAVNNVFGVLGRESNNILFRKLLNVELFQWVQQFLR